MTTTTQDTTRETIQETLWDGVIGHDDAVRTLREALDGGRVAHAWLFTGPPGVGKAYVARLLAAALNCEGVTDSGRHPADADGTCSSCRRVLRGVHPDVHQVEPEGDVLRVEEVRAVREEAWRTRHEGRTCVFILDRADRMNENAANALLKVLEEPPHDVVFVLTAPSPDALVGTVPSRARVLPFADLPPAVLTAGLAREPGVEPADAAWAAAAGHGRVGRARALLADARARDRRDRVLALLPKLVTGTAADALDAATVITRTGDDAAAALADAHAAELESYDQTFGKARGTAALRRRIEARHKRAARRVRFDAVREAVSDLLAGCRDVAASAAGGADARLVHTDRAESTATLATRVTATAALLAAAAFGEADRRLFIGAAPQLTCETALLAAHGAFHHQPLPLARIDLRR